MVGRWLGSTITPSLFGFIVLGRFYEAHCSTHENSCIINTMEYTHTFEFSLDSIRAEGQINFDLTDPEILIEGDTEMSLSEREKVQEIFKRLVICHRELGQINKIEVLPK